MDKLTFHKQIILCLCMIFAGATLAFVTGEGFFHNAALFFSDLLF